MVGREKLLQQVQFEWEPLFLLFTGRSVSVRRLRKKQVKENSNKKNSRNGRQGWVRWLVGGGGREFGRWKDVGGGGRGGGSKSMVRK